MIKGNCEAFLDCRGHLKFYEKIPNELDVDLSEEHIT